MAVRGATYDNFGGPDCMYVLYGRIVLICTMHEALHRAWKFQLVKSNYVPLMLKKVLQMQFSTEVLVMKKFVMRLVLIVWYCLIPVQLRYVYGFRRSLC